MDQSLLDNEDAENVQPDGSESLEPPSHQSSSDLQPDGSALLEPPSYQSSSDPQSSGLIDVDANGNPLPPGPDDWRFITGVQAPIDSAPPSSSQPIISKEMDSTTVSEDWEAMGAEALRARAKGQPFRSSARQQQESLNTANHTADAVKENSRLVSVDVRPIKAIGVTTSFEDHDPIRAEVTEPQADAEKVPLGCELHDAIRSDVENAQENPPRNGGPETNSVRGDDRNDRTVSSDQALTSNESLEDQMTAHSTYFRCLSEGDTILYAARTIIGQPFRSPGSRETIPVFTVLDMPQKPPVHPPRVLRPMREVTHSTPERHVQHMRLLDHDRLLHNSSQSLSPTEKILRKYSSKACLSELRLPTNPSNPTKSVPRYASTDEETTDSDEPASSDESKWSDCLFHVRVHQSLSTWLLTLTL